MDIKIWKRNIQNHPLIRYTAIALLSAALILYVLRFEAFHQYLLGLCPGKTGLGTVWTLLVKLSTYGITILINFCLLYLLTKRFTYSMAMVVVSLVVLITGALLVFAREQFTIPVPLALIAFFVKLNKSFILLVLFVAGYYMNKSLHKE